MERTAEVARLVAEGFSQADATAIVEGTQAFANLNEELRTAKTNLENKLKDYKVKRGRTRSYPSY